MPYQDAEQVNAGQPGWATAAPPGGQTVAPGQQPTFFMDPQAESQLLTGQQVNQAEIAQFRNQWANDPTKVTAAAAFAHVYPKTDPKVLIGLVNQGYDTTDKVAKFANDVSSGTAPDLAKLLTPTKQKSHRSFFSDPVGWTEDQVVKPAIRGVSTGLSTGLQFGEGIFRNDVADIESLNPLRMAQAGLRTMTLGMPTPVSLATGDWQSLVKQTDVGQAGQQVAQGKAPDLGTGFFTGGQVAAGQAAAARAAAPTIGGHAMTPGRLAASVVTEPGTRPFNLLSGLVDAGVSWEDPGNKALAALGESMRAAKTFSSVAPAVDAAAQAANVADKVGLIRGIRNAVVPQTLDNFLSSPGFRKTAENIATTNDPAELWIRSGRQLPIDVTSQLARASTPDDVTNIVRDAALRGDVTGPFSLAGHASYQVRQQILDHSRVAGWLGSLAPAGKMDVNDPEGTVANFERFLRGGHVDNPTVHSLLNEMIDAAPSRDPAQMGEVLWAGAKAINDRAVQVLGDNHTLGSFWNHIPGVKGPDDAQGLANHITNLVKTTSDQDVNMGRAYFLDEAGRPGYNPIARVDGTNLPGNSPHLLTEYLNQTVPLPDMGEINRATSTMARILTSTPYEVPRSVVSHLTNAWAAAHIIRPALIARLTMEAQSAMGASGLTNVLHPLQYIGLLAAHDGKFGDLLSKIPGIEPKITSGIEEPLFGDAAKALSDGQHDLSAGLTHGAGHLLSPQTAQVHWYDRVPTDTQTGIEGWAHELTQLHNDPVAHAAATAETPDLAKQAFWDGDLAPYRTMLQRRGAVNLTSRLGADDYMNSIFDRLAIKSGNDPRLKDAIATGEINGTPLLSADLTGRTTINPKAVDELRSLRAEGVGPDYVKAGVNWQDRIVQGRGEKLGAMWDHGVNRMFSYLVGQPDNFFNREPGLAQLYWKHAADVLPFATPEVQQRVLAAAEGANLPKQLLGSVRSAAARGSGDLGDLQDFRLLVKGRAVDESHQIFHNLASRSQFGNAMRSIVPFGDAWRTMLQRWTGLFTQRPQLLHRVDQVISAARAHDPFVDLGLEQPHQGGFFHQDAYGNEVFTLPGSQLASQMLTGVPVGLDSPVKGASLVSSGLPGMGPGVTFAASAFLPHTPNLDWVRNKLLPFGQEQHITNVKDVANQLVPSWMQKFMNGMGTPLSQRQYNDSVNAVINYKLSTGKYQTSGPNAQSETQRLIHDSMVDAKHLWFLRGLAQATAPSAPTFDWMAQDKTGTLQTQKAMADRFYQLMKVTGDRQIATESFVHQFGPNAFFSTVPVTRNITANLPATNTAANWAANNPDLAKNFNLVYGLFAPQSPNGPDKDYSAAEFQRQLDSGERQDLSPEQRIQLGNRAVAQAQYNFYRDQLASRSGGRLTKPQRDWLAQQRTQLENTYPGFRDDTSLIQGPPTRDMIKQLAGIVKDPRISSTPAGQASILYMRARLEALTTLAREQKNPSMDITLPTNSAAERYRTALQDYALALIAKYPEFQGVYDTVFAHSGSAGGDLPSSQQVSPGTVLAELAPQ